MPDRYQLISPQMGLPAGTEFEREGAHTFHAIVPTSSYVIVNEEHIRHNPEIFRPVIERPELEPGWRWLEPHDEICVDDVEVVRPDNNERSFGYKPVMKHVGSCWIKRRIAPPCPEGWREVGEDEPLNSRTDVADFEAKSGHQIESYMDGVRLVDATNYTKPSGYGPFIRVRRRVPWKPAEKEEYFYISDGPIPRSTWYISCNPSDQIHISTGNCFRTREQAESVLKATLELWKSKQEGQ